MLVYAGEALAKYAFGHGHPFGPDRFHVFWNAFLTEGLNLRCSVLPPVAGVREDLLLFHTPDYVRHVEQLSREGFGMLDPDTPVFSGAFEAALTVVGSVLDAAARIVHGEDRSAFVPIAGLHHARRDGSAGFCIFNDCVIAVEALRRRHGLRRIAYVDIDAHHADGVFYAFEGDPELIFADLHEDGRFLYPGTGHAHETGKGEAAGCKLNVPLPPGADDAIFFKLWPTVAAFIEKSRPEFIIFQCGADSIRGDPITTLSFSSAAHHHAARELFGIARRIGSKGLLALGGGGYNRDNIAKAWTAVVRGVIETEAE
ncbi:MAG: acetoin utilization protein AcuC [Gammaproteobacteria bacterium]|nr:acetoin utilization protein AcuC [Gammaproteobacteria bacterium]